MFCTSCKHDVTPEQETLFGNGTVNLCPECGQVLTDADDLEDRDIGEPVG